MLLCDPQGVINNIFNIAKSNQRNQQIFEETRKVKYLFKYQGNIKRNRNGEELRKVKMKFPKSPKDVPCTSFHL